MAINILFDLIVLFAPWTHVHFAYFAFRHGQRNQAPLPTTQRNDRDNLVYSEVTQNNQRSLSSSQTSELEDKWPTRGGYSETRQENRRQSKASESPMTSYSGSDQKGLERDRGIPWVSNIFKITYQSHIHLMFVITIILLSCFVCFVFFA